MSWQRRNRFWPRYTRRLTTGLLLVVYLTTCTGFLPAPSRAFKQKSGQPFPCQDHPCGCATAEDCWRHCCCFTAEERWAWAREHEVEPPEYAERSAAKSWSTARLRDQVEGHDPAHAGCSRCQSRDPAPIPSRGPVMLAAWRCQGLNAWLSAGAVLPFVPEQTWGLDHPIVDWRLADRDRSPCILPLVPPDPPPRLV